MVKIMKPEQLKNDWIYSKEMKSLNFHFTSTSTAPQLQMQIGPKEHHYPAHALGPLLNVGKFIIQNSQTASAEVTAPKPW